MPWNSLDELKAHLGVETSAYDGVLTRLEIVARSLINAWCNRAIDETVYIDRFDATGREQKVILSRVPVTTICAITVSNEALSLQSTILCQKKAL